MQFRKNYIYILLIISSCILILQSSYKILVNQKEETTVSVSKKIINIGEVKLNTHSEATFIIGNTGKSDLKILSVKPDCQCTVAQWDEFPIPPGQVSVIRAEYHGTTTGFFQKNIVVEVNSKGSPIILTFRGKVIE